MLPVEHTLYAHLCFLPTRAHVPNTGWRGSDLYRRWKLGTLPEGTTVRQWLGYPAAVAFHSTDGTSCTREATAEKTIAHTTVVR